MDVSRLEREGTKKEYGNGTVSYYWAYKEEDGTAVIIEGDSENGYRESRISENSCHEIYREYFPDGILKFKVLPLFV